MCETVLKRVSSSNGVPNRDVESEDIEFYLEGESFKLL